ncbi:hypothetical protein [Peredibacter starrii]|uniref:Uncharacterized protein n=1 Tax=Peredibacter starrii TaxID=28202 RepID=A0AAX4HM02_9BACT|nr:hypothetical protein [Peredibacter starrii]WPU63954.1 hypothetical protein SOO65_14760 [Peredibacter starrii]
MKYVLCLMLTSTSALATDYGYLKPEDQKYYKNDSLDGNNQRERVDSTVKEINKLHGEIAAMKAQIQTLRQEVDELKKK